MVVREIRGVKFEEVRTEVERFGVVEDIMGKVTGFVQKCPYLFSYFSRFLKEDFKETTKFFKVTTYCFLAERFAFNINEFYCEAFDFQEEGQQPKKRKKLPEIDEVET
jgi:hypothetical protein